MWAGQTFYEFSLSPPHLLLSFCMPLLSLSALLFSLYLSPPPYLSVYSTFLLGFSVSYLPLCLEFAERLLHTVMGMYTDV